MKNLSPEMNAEVRKAVKAFKRKVRRLEAKGVTASLLPEVPSTKALKNAYKDTESLQRRLDMMASFSSRGDTRKTKKGVVGTDAMFEYRKKENEESIKRYKDQLASAQGQRTKYKSRLQSYKSNLRAKIKYLSRSPERMDAKEVMRQYQNTMTDEKMYKKNTVFKQNFMDKLDDYAEIGEVNRRKVNKLKRKLDQIPLEDFFRVIDTNPEFERIEQYIFDSPTRKGQKRARPRYEPEEIAGNIDDLLASVDDIIANSL